MVILKSLPKSTDVAEIFLVASNFLMNTIL